MMLLEITETPYCIGQQHK